jgi:tetratricopeptide (TPR) repeat protein
MLIRALSLAWALALLHSSPATAQTVEQDDARARTHFEAGRSYYEVGNCERAVEEFRQALALSNRPALHMNVAICEERLGMWDEAAESLTLFRDALPPEDEQRARIEQRIANLRERAARAQEEARMAREAEAAQRAQTDVPRPEARRVYDEGLLVPAVALFAGGAAVLVVTAVTGGLAISERDHIAAGCGASQSCSPAELQALRDFALSADVTLGVGLGLVVIGGILLWADPPHEDEVEVAPVVSQNEIGVRIHVAL